MSTAGLRKNVKDALQAEHGANVPAAKIGNAGLFLERYLPAIEEGEKPLLAAHLKTVCNVPAPAAYGLAYGRRKQDLTTINAGATVSQVFEVVERMSVGLGGESIHETSISLLPLYGVPFIPGTALKGLCRRYAESGHVSGWLDDANREAQLDVLFGYQRGSSGSAAYVTFHDAWYVPGSAKDNRPLTRDRMTPHHGEYNATQGEQAPSDFDQPTPVAFLSARGKYLVTLTAVNEAWAMKSLELLSAALRRFGVGAKTSSGYGRLEAVSDDGLIDQLRAYPAKTIRDNYDQLLGRAMAMQETHGVVADRLLEILDERLWAARGSRPVIELESRPVEPETEPGQPPPGNAQELANEAATTRNPHDLGRIYMEAKELDSVDKRIVFDAIWANVHGMSKASRRNLNSAVWFKQFRSDTEVQS